MGAILKNVTYKGGLRSGTTFSDPFKELLIIDPFTFDLAEELIEERINEEGREDFSVEYIRTVTFIR